MGKVVSRTIVLVFKRSILYEKATTVCLGGVGVGVGGGEGGGGGRGHDPAYVQAKREYCVPEPITNKTRIEAGVRMFCCQSAGRSLPGELIVRPVEFNQSAHKPRMRRTVTMPMVLKMAD